MPTPRTVLAAAALTAAALTPATALAKADRTPELGGSPQIRIVDANHAQLNFAADELPRTKAGKLDAKITFADGERVSGLKLRGRHGDDKTYVATVSSPRAMKDHAKFSVTFRLGKSKPVTRSVTLYRPGAHN
jgi:hypothetical protein